MSEYSENEYLQKLNTYIPDNSTQEISPRDIRDSITDLVDSSHRFLEPHFLKAKNIQSHSERQTSVGELALSKTYLVYQSGVDNSAFGYAALQGNVFGQKNTALGSYALGCNLDGNHNTAVGFSAISANIEGHGNVAVGNRALCKSKDGNFNIAIGHGAGYYVGVHDSYQFFLGSHPEASGDPCLDGSGVPLMRGDLQELKLAIGTNDLHNYGTLQVSGDVSPTTSRVSSLGNANRAWSSVNDVINFPNSNTIEVAAKLLPDLNNRDFGSMSQRWDGYFTNIFVSGLATINDLEYTTIEQYLYEAKTLHLATDGLCDADNLGLGPGAVCGYLSDQGIDGAGFEVHSSGDDYRRDYRFVYRFPDTQLQCLVEDSAYSRSHWESNISLSTVPGMHVQTDRVLGRETLSLVNEDCCGVFISGCNITVGQEVYDVCYSGLNIVDTDFNLSLSDSGIINQRFISNTDNCASASGFALRFTNTPAGEATSGVFFAVERLIPDTSNDAKFDSITVDINGNVGVSNSANFDPLTIFNVNTSGQNSTLRVSADGEFKPSLELLGNTNVRTSGFQIIYNTTNDDSILGNLGYGYGYCLVDVGDTDRHIVDFDLIKPSGDEGFEIGFMSATEQGFVGIGRTKENEDRIFTAHAPLTIHHTDRCGGLSGTISIKEQIVTPTHSDGYGKIYVKPFVVQDHLSFPMTQSPFFLDDYGNEHRLILSKYIDSDGLVYTDSKGNTFAGLNSASNKPFASTTLRNTFYGKDTGSGLTTGDDNTIMGWRSGSGISTGSCNTILGSQNMRYTNGDKNIVIGCNNIGAEASTDGFVNNSILIGTNLKSQEEILDGTIQIGSGDLPVIDGRMGTPQYLNFNVDYINLYNSDDDVGFKFKNDNNKLCVLFSSGSIVDREIGCFESDRFKADKVEVTTLHFADGTSQTTAGGGGSDTINNYNTYVTAVSGASFDENCNAIYVNDSGNIDGTKNSRSVFIGCETAFEATGWKSSVMIGSEAGRYATVENPSLSIDTASVFIGMRAGYDADASHNSVFLGTNAGKNSQSATESIFLGPNAGLYSQSKNSIAIGENALRVSEFQVIDPSSAGRNNIEILAGIEDDDRLLYQRPTYSNRLNINNVIAGDSYRRVISIGDAILSPDAPLSVRRDAEHDNNDWSHDAYSVFIDNISHENEFVPDSGFLYPLYLFSTDAANDPSHVAGSDVIIWGGDTALSGFPNVTFYQPFIDGEALGESGNLDQGASFAAGHAGGYDIFNSGLIPNDYIQTWYCRDEFVAGISCDGFKVDGDIIIEGDVINNEGDIIINNSGALKLTREGIMQDQVLSPSSFCSPTSGVLLTKVIDGENCTDGESLYVINRDSTLDIHVNAYVQVHKVNNEWRPVWVSCSGSSS